MGKLFNYEGPLVQFLVKAFDVILVNMLWLICSIPMITLGATTTAMYAVVFKIISGENPQVIKCFFEDFKSNFKQATSIWLVFIAFGLIIWLDLYLLVFVFSELSLFQKIICAVLAILGFVWLTMLLYVFPLLSKFENTAKQTIINSYLIPLLNPVHSLVLVALNLLIVLVSIYVFPAIAFGASTAVNAFVMNKVFCKYISDADEDKRNALDRIVEDIYHQQL